eukprot:1159482-Pelagomonas_calceolata.AAC.1
MSDLPHSNLQGLLALALLCKLTAVPPNLRVRLNRSQCTLRGPPGIWPHGLTALQFCCTQY